MGPQFVRKAYPATVDLVDDLVRMLNHHLISATAGQSQSTAAAVVNIRVYLSALTLDVVCRVAFSHDLNCLYNYDASLHGKVADDSLRMNIDKTSHAGIMRLFAPEVLWTAMGVDVGQMKGVNQYFSDMVDSFLVPRRLSVSAVDSDDSDEEQDDDDEDLMSVMLRKSEDHSKDLLSALLHKTSDGEMEFSDKEIRDEVLALLLAGHDTTSNTITNVFLEVCRHPETVTKLREEIAILVGRNGTPTFEDLSKFVYVDNVIREAQRIHPVIMGVDRVAAKDVEVLGYQFKKGDYFSCNLQTAMLSKEYWGSDSLEFNPDRWFQKEEIVDGAFLPFSAGLHSCPGSKMALLETKIVLIKLWQQFDFSIVDGQRLRHVDGISIHLPDGLMLKFAAANSLMSLGSPCATSGNGLGCKAPTECSKDGFCVVSSTTPGAATNPQSTNFNATCSNFGNPCVGSSNPNPNPNPDPFLCVAQSATTGTCLRWPSTGIVGINGKCNGMSLVCRTGLQCVDGTCQGSTVNRGAICNIADQNGIQTVCKFTDICLVPAFTTTGGLLSGQEQTTFSVCAPKPEFISLPTSQVFLDVSGICLGLSIYGFGRNIAEQMFFCDGYLHQSNGTVIPSGVRYPYPRNTSFIETLAISQTGGVCDGFPVTPSRCGAGHICLWLISSTSAACTTTLATLPDQITNTNSSNPTCVPEQTGVCLGAWICFLGNNGVEPVYFCDGALVSQNGFNTTLPFHHPLSILPTSSSGGLDVGMIAGIVAGLLTIVAVVVVGYAFYVKKATSKQQQDEQNQSPRKVHRDGGSYGTDLLPLSTSFAGKSSSSSSASSFGENTAIPVSVHSVKELPLAKDQEPVSFVNNRLPLSSNNAGNRSSTFGPPSPASSNNAGNRSSTFGPPSPASSNNAGNRSSTFGPPSSNNAGNRSSTFGPPSPASSNNAGNRSSTFGPQSPASSNNAGNRLSTVGPPSSNNAGNRSSTFGPPSPASSNNAGNRSSTFGPPSPASSNNAGNRLSTFGPPSSNNAGNRLSTFGPQSPPSSNNAGNRSSTFGPPSIPSSASNNAGNRSSTFPSSDVGKGPVSNIHSDRTESAPSSTVSTSIPSFTRGQDVNPPSNVYSRRTSGYGAPNGPSYPISSSIPSSTAGQTTRSLPTIHSERIPSTPSSTGSSYIPASSFVSSVPPILNREQTSSQSSNVSASGTASRLTVGTTNSREPPLSVTQTIVESPTTTPTTSAPPAQPTIAPPSTAAINAAIAMKARFSKVETTVQSVPGFYRTLHDHVATTEYELSFEKDVRVYVTSKPDQEGWCNALIAGDAGLVHHTKLGPIG
ncbi:UNVERIFIED_CONTAM: hypothetical protein HDU68_010166 [Siphonaria sp. JEL0065]|nr:hypothetical protein HDU68_010166 [Siphonaria sp. JEL0065]